MDNGLRLEGDGLAKQRQLWSRAMVFGSMAGSGEVTNERPVATSSPLNSFLSVHASACEVSAIEYFMILQWLWILLFPSQLSINIRRCAPSETDQEGRSCMPCTFRNIRESHF